jgi:hypothetical protein
VFSSSVSIVVVVLLVASNLRIRLQRPLVQCDERSGLCGSEAIISLDGGIGGDVVVKIGGSYSSSTSSFGGGLAACCRWCRVSVCRMIMVPRLLNTRAITYPLLVLLGSLRRRGRFHTCTYTISGCTVRHKTCRCCIVSNLLCTVQLVSLQGGPIATAVDGGSTGR